MRVIKVIVVHRLIWNKDIFDLHTLLTQRQDRLWSVLHERYKYNTSIKRGQKFLLNHVDSKLSTYCDVCRFGWLYKDEHEIAS